jgi:hypothetical protein
MNTLSIVFIGISKIHMYISPIYCRICWEELISESAEPTTYNYNLKPKA